MGMDMPVKPDPKMRMKGMAFMVIGNFLLAFVLIHNIGAWSFVPDLEESKIQSVFNVAFFSCLGFYVPYYLGATVWEKRSWKLFFINVGYAFVSLLFVAGIIIYMN